jgi:membrane fusion protein, epimerase transport system
MYRRTVQHQEGGIVDEILVRDGSRVKAGDGLVVLKDVKVEAGMEVILTQLDGEIAKAARAASRALRSCCGASPSCSWRAATPTASSSS